MIRYNFGLALYQTKLLYDITFNNEDDFYEIALNAWEIIGNKEYRLYKFIGQVDSQTLSLELPCNCNIIEAVVAPGEDWNYTSNIHNFGDWKSRWVEEYIEHFKLSHHPLYSHGHYVHYNLVGNTLYFDKSYDYILVLYKGVVLDDDGLPYINNKEMNAIATYVAWILKYKEALLSNNSGLAQFAQQLEKRWYIQCDQARTPEELTQNDFNEIADVKTSWNRKTYGKSLFPLMK